MITSPYNFVPLNEDIYYPEWGDKVSHDMPFSDSEDGTIEVTVENVSPLFTRDGQASRAQKKTEYSAHIPSQGGKLYYIPSTSIKGMLRATMEVMAFGKMKEKTHFANRWFGYRDIGGAQKDNGISSYNEIMQDCKAGWLTMDDEDLYIEPCEFTKILMSEIEEKITLYGEKKKINSPWGLNQNLAIKGEMYPAYTDDNGLKGRLVCTGYIDSKKHEYLFYNVDHTTKTSKLKISDTVKEKFFTIYEHSPKFKNQEFKKYFTEYLKKGKAVAVFYLLNKGEVDIFGLSRMIRYPYKLDVNRLVRNQQFISKDEARYDLPETIFGIAEKDNSLKGRVQIGNAFCDSIVEDYQLETKELLLGQPKASYYPLYIQQDKSPYKNYDNAQAIAGRKFYRIFKADETTDLEEKNTKNKNVISTLRCIPKGHLFKFKINIHNLRPMEIGAILSSLTFHKTLTSFHAIGQAKNFGYGKLGHADIKLQGLKKSVDEYLRDFELAMNIFTLSRKKPFRWNESKQLKKLANITSEHDVNTLQIMTLSGYKNTKRVHAFYKLKQLSDNKVKTLLSEDDFLSIGDKANDSSKEERIAEVKSKYSSLAEQVREKTSQCDYYAAIKAYNDLIYLCTNSAISSLEEIKDIKSKTEQALNENKATILINCCHSMFEIAERHLSEGKKDQAKEDYKKIADWCLSSGLTETDDIKGLLDKAKDMRDNIDLIAYRASISDDYTEARGKEASDDVNDLIEAKGIYEEIKDKLSTRNLPFDVEQSKIEELTERIDQIEKEKKRKEKEEKEMEIKAKLEAGLTAVLDEKYVEGSNAGQFKVKSLKMCNDKVKKWLKDAERTELTDEEKEALVKTVRRIKQSEKQKPYDKDKEWNTRLADYIGKDKAFELYNE